MIKYLKHIIFATALLFLRCSEPEPSPPVKINANQTVSVNANGNDWEMVEDGGWFWDSFFDDGSGLALTPGSYTSNRAWTALRFILTSDIPSTATITASSITVLFSGFESYDADDFHRIYITDSGDAAALTTAGQRPSQDGGSTTIYPSTLTEGIRWPSEGGLTFPAASGEMVSTDISSLIQHIIDTYAGIDAGEAIVVWITAGNTLQADDTADILAFEDGETPSSLSIEWAISGRGQIIQIF